MLRMVGFDARMENRGDTGSGHTGLKAQPQIKAMTLAETHGFALPTQWRVPLVDYAGRANIMY
ncbi:hypothetical protein JCM31598_14000 [Desulfonatronum parangueonense]